jgi:cobalt/nickel transport system permease protein
MTVTPFIAGVQLLHLPDGFLSLSISIICWMLTAVMLTLAVRRTQKAFDDRLIPLAGIMAAFIFAGQMINFPVAGGTSGHLVGATLAAVVLGPWLGILVMTAVIGLQALLFQDGGLVVMGANILVMGVIPIMVGYGLYRPVVTGSRRMKLVAATVAAWLSILAAAFVTALLLGFSGTSSLRIAIPAMMGIHALIGVGESLITVSALSFIMGARPQLLQTSVETGGRGWIAAGMIIALSLVLLAPLAATSPDGLEWFAQQNEFIDAALASPYSLWSGYTIPGFGNESLSTVLAGSIGTVVVALVAFGLAWLVRKARKNRERVGSAGD